MSTVDLRAYTRKELATMAKRDQVTGWHSMTKDELIRALRNIARRKTVKRRTAHGSSNGETTGTQAKLNGQSRTNGQTNGHSRGESSQRAGQAAARRGYRRIAAARSEPSDRLTVQICDSHWLMARWSLGRGILDRAAAALGVEWHQSVPVVRVFDVTIDDASSVSKSFVKDFEIQGPVDHWYVFLEDPSRSYRLCVGYRTPSGRFFSLAESSRIRMPAPASGDRRNGSESAGTPAAADNGAWPAPHAGTDLARLARNGNGKVQGSGFTFEVEAELIIHGRTHPDASLTLAGERVPLGPDGRFTYHLMLPEGRQVVPTVAVTPNGAEQRTIILAVERNTKELEPQSLDDHGF